MRTSRAAAYVATWVAVVALGSTVVWAVISRAGEGVVTSDSAGPRTADGTSAPRTPSAAGSPSRSPSGSPSASRTPSPTPTSSSPAAAAPVARSWSGVGGVVVVVCRGAAAELEAARPDTGFRAEVDDTGPDRVEVELVGQGDSDAETRVRATCVGGTPTFEVDG